MHAKILDLPYTTGPSSKADQKTGSTESDGVFSNEILSAADTDGEPRSTDFRLSPLFYITKQAETALGSGEETMANDQTRKNYFDDFLKAKFEHIDYMFSQFREDVLGMRGDLSDFKRDVGADLADFRKDVVSENRRTKLTVIVTGVTVVLGLAAIVYATAQIHTSWLTALTQIFSNKTVP